MATEKLPERGLNFNKQARSVVTNFMYCATQARTNCSLFCDFVLYDDVQDHIVTDQMHYVWDEFVEYTWNQGYHAAIMAPVRHGKTTRWVIGRSLWQIGKNHNARILITSSLEAEAAKRVESVRRYIDNSVEYHAVFPDVQRGDVWEKTKFIVRRTAMGPNPTMEAHGVLHGPPGAGGDLIIFDDVTDFKNTLMMPSLREKVYDAMTSLWLKRLDRTEARALLVGIAWHEGDALHKLMRRGGFRFLIQRVSPNFKEHTFDVVGPL